MDKLIGRQYECQELQRALASSRSEFIVLYGRRRVGKTFLVRRFFDDIYTFRYVGSHRQSQSYQLQNFRETLIAYSGNADIPQIEDWHTAFVQLQRYLEQSPDKRKVIFFDEIPWMDTQGSGFTAELEYFWANWVQNRDDVVFIACGSATTWMKDKLEDNQGGLHNRITLRIYLRPFYLDECRAYLTEHGFDWDEYQIIQCYMIFGGVPFYLSLLQPELSLPQNVDNLIFKKGGELSNEFSELYNALFNKADRYIAVVDVGGSSDTSDWSVIAVIDRHLDNEDDDKRPEVVAQWRGHTDHDALVWKAAQIAQYYNKALLVFESNTLECEKYVDSLNFERIMMAYPNIYHRKCSDGRLRPGFQTNRDTKPSAIHNLIAYVRDGAYIERDTKAANEMESYEFVRNAPAHKSYAARRGKHDDILMTRAIALLLIEEMRLSEGRSRAVNPNNFIREGILF